jgi:hypothetical protein
VVYHTQPEPCAFLYRRYSDWEHGDRGRWIRWRPRYEHRREVGLRRPDPDPYSHFHADSDGYGYSDGDRDATAYANAKGAADAAA